LSAAWEPAAPPASITAAAKTRVRLKTMNIAS
jgi:hypothetical protein